MRFTGVRYEADEPWYATDIRMWLAIVRQVNEGVFKGAEGFRAQMEMILDGKPYMLRGGKKVIGPTAVYSLYQEWKTASRSA